MKTRHLRVKMCMRKLESGYVRPGKGVAKESPEPCLALQHPGSELMSRAVVIEDHAGWPPQTMSVSEN